jgi:hypothetical protein
LTDAPIYNTKCGTLAGRPARVPRNPIVRPSWRLYRHDGYGHLKADRYPLRIAGRPCVCALAHPPKPVVGWCLGFISYSDVRHLATPFFRWSRFLPSILNLLRGVLHAPLFECALDRRVVDYVAHLVSRKTKPIGKPVDRDPVCPDLSKNPFFHATSTCPQVSVRCDNGQSRDHFCRSIGRQRLAMNHKFRFKLCNPLAKQCGNVGASIIGQHAGYHMVAGWSRQYPPVGKTYEK